MIGVVGFIVLIGCWGTDRALLGLILVGVEAWYTWRCYRGMAKHAYKADERVSGQVRPVARERPKVPKVRSAEGAIPGMVLDLRGIRGRKVHV